MTPVVLALDSGTSVVKAVAFDIDGTVLATAARPNAYRMGAGGEAEQDCERSWDDAAAVLTELAHRIDTRAVAALGVTGQGDGTWLVDASGAAIEPGWLWLDSRAAGIVEHWRSTGTAASAFVHTGTGVNACQQPAHLAWMDRHAPDRLARAAVAFHPKDFLHLRLTGIAATSPCEGTFSFGSFRTRAYEEDVLHALGLTHLRRLLPPILEGTRTTSPLTAKAAARTGLPAGLPVSLGAVDVACTGLGAGLYGAGEDAGVSVIGSTGMHLRLVPRVEQVAPSPLGTGYCMAFPVPGHTIQAQTNMAATLNLDWLAGLMAEAAAYAGATLDRPAALRALDAAVLDRPPGRAVFHPFISSAGERGPFTDAAARATLTGLDQDVTLADIGRAVFEGLCFAARDCFSAIGGAPAEIRVTGGAARSPALTAILAACLDRPVGQGAQTEAGAAGAAMMAAVAIGLFPDMAACAATWITPRLGPLTRPDATLAADYDRLFPLYRDSYAALAPTWHGLRDRRAA